jgi:hypothetical protein
MKRSIATDGKRLPRSRSLGRGFCSITLHLLSFRPQRRNLLPLAKSMPLAQGTSTEAAPISGGTRRRPRRRGLGFLAIESGPKRLIPDSLLTWEKILLGFQEPDRSRK